MESPFAEPYVHQELNREVTAIGGYYVLNAEVRIPFQGREVFYLTGYAHFDTSCCGAGGCSYARVIGFIIAWKTRKDKDGHVISIVEPVCDPVSRRKIRGLIKHNGIVQQVQFE